MPDLRLVTFNAATLNAATLNAAGPRAGIGALVEQIVPLAPDVVVVREGPRRLRWRTRSAHLAQRMRLVHAAGGEASLGNLVLVSLRVTVREEWAVQFPLVPGRRMRGAVLARCAVTGAAFLVAGTQLAADERVAQATILTRTLSNVDVPAILLADVAEGPGGPARRLLAEGRTAAGPPVDTTAILVSGGVEVRECRVLPGGLAVLLDLTLPAAEPPTDHGQMVSGQTSH